MSLLWMLPFAAQGGLMGIDELWFHRERGLPRWERIGHPIDTSSVLLCLAIPWVFSFGVPGLWIYGGAAALSCLLVTKDENVHARHCRPAEHWVHSVLFMLHPLVLGIVVLLWAAREHHPLARAVTDATAIALPAPDLAGALLLGQALVVAAVAAYQAVYWSLRSP